MDLDIDYYEANQTGNTTQSYFYTCDIVDQYHFYYCFK